MSDRDTALDISHDFTLDPFQVRAIEALDAGLGAGTAGSGLLLPTI